MQKNGRMTNGATEVQTAPPADQGNKDDPYAAGLKSSVSISMPCKFTGGAVAQL